MSTQTIFASVAMAIAMGGCTAADQLMSDRSRPELAWGTAAPGSEVVQRLAEAAPQLSGEPHARFKVMVRAADDVAVASLQLKVVGTFRCATATGDWIAPFDVVREVPVAESGRATDSRMVYASTRLQLLGTSCGRFAVPMRAGEEELYAVGGSYSLHATATDTAGKSSESVMTIDTLPTTQALAAL